MAMCRAWPNRSRLVLVSTALQIGGAAACTAIAVGKDASASGFAMVSHSDDSGPTTTDFRLARVPSRTWPPGSQRPLYNWNIRYPRVVSAERAPVYAPETGQADSVPIGHISQVPFTYGYWDTDYGAQNEVGLSIGESTCTAKTVGWPADPDKPYGYNRIGIEDMSKIAMERCKSARCAVDLMGSLAVEQGFYSADSGPPDKPSYAGSSECLAVADSEDGEVWIFNVMTGRNNASAIWAAQRLPSDHVTGIGNAFTIREIDFSDADNFRYSPGVTDLAREMGWWNPDKGQFSFFGAYGYQPINGGLPWDPPGIKNVLRFYSGRRHWRIFNLLSPHEGAKLDPNTGHLPETKNPYPFSLPAPKGSVTLRMVLDAHRDHYEGTPYDLTKGMAAGPYGNPNRAKATIAGQWERAIAMFRTSWSYVIEARPAGRGRMWYGQDCAHGTVYLPFYAGAVDDAPRAWRIGTMQNFSTDVAWWAFNFLNSYSEINFALVNADVRKKAQEIEDRAMSEAAKWEDQANGLAAASGKDAALAHLTEQSNKFAEEILAQWWDFAFKMVAKFNRKVVTYNNSEIGEDTQQYPNWWLESPDVGFTMWSPTGPFHGIGDLTPKPFNSAAHSQLSDVVSATWTAAVAMAVAAPAAALAALVAYRAGKRASAQEPLGSMYFAASP